jgi:hypothetical protein
MTRLLLIIVFLASSTGAEARKQNLRRKPKKTAELAETAWASDRCTQEARERRAKAKKAKAKPKAKAEVAVREEPVDEVEEETIEEDVERTAAAPVMRAPSRWQIAAGAVAGGNALGMRLARTEGGGGLGTALSAAYGVSGMVSYRVSGRIHAGVAVDGVLTGPLGEGMQYRTTEEVAGVAPFKHHQVDARGELAYRGSVELAARAGYHYGHLAIDTTAVDMPITGEAIAGYTLGLAAALPMNGKWTMSAALDLMPAGVQAPTVEVTDGMFYGTTATGAWATGGLTYRWTGRWLGIASYRYGRSTIAMTDNAADPNTATRVDQSHTIMAGLGLSL